MSSDILLIDQKVKEYLRFLESSLRLGNINNDIFLKRGWTMVRIFESDTMKYNRGKYVIIVPISRC